MILPLGGLVSGWLVYTLAPEAEGHGTDAVIDAYHIRQGEIAPRVPLVKIVASALTLGTGGSGGREGPIAQIGAGFGSFLAGVMRLRPADRRVLMAAGMGAGIAAIFRAPLAGSLFAAEVLYSSPEFEPEVIMPAALASVVAYSTFGVIFGWQAAVHDSDAQLQQSDGTGGLSAAGVMGGIFGDALHAVILCHYPLVSPFAVAAKDPAAVGALLTGVVALALYYAFGRTRSCWAFSVRLWNLAMGTRRPTERKPSRCCWRLRWARFSPPG